MGLTLAACSEPVVDARSNETLKDSIGNVKRSLPVEKHDHFEFYIERLQKVKPRDFRLLVHGKTGTELMIMMERFSDLLVFLQIVDIYFMDNSREGEVTFPQLDESLTESLIFKDVYKNWGPINRRESSFSYTDEETGETYSLDYVFNP